VKGPFEKELTAKTGRDPIARSGEIPRFASGEEPTTVLTMWTTTDHGSDAMYGASRPRFGAGAPMAPSAVGSRVQCPTTKTNGINRPMGSGGRSG
jgi:hypothetical protein